MKTLLLPLLLAPLIFGSCQTKEAGVSAANFDLVKLGTGVYACINTFGGKAICNAGIIDNGEATIIFDTFLAPEAAEELIQVTTQLKLSPIRYVVNSHSHNDHVRGNQCFPPNVKILSTKRTAELIASEEPKTIAYEKDHAPAPLHHFDSLFATFRGDTATREYKEIKMMRAYYEVLSESYAEVRTRVPDTFVTGAMSLDGSKRKVRLIEEVRGHTESDLVLYLPDDSTIFAGDLVFNECHPYLADGDPDGWKRALRAMESMPVKAVVPGHGSVGRAETITATREYIEDLEATVLRLKGEGVGRMEITGIKIPDRYRNWWFEEFYPENAVFLYERVK